MNKINKKLELISKQSIAPQRMLRNSNEFYRAISEKYDTRSYDLFRRAEMIFKLANALCSIKRSKSFYKLALNLSFIMRDLVGSTLSQWLQQQHSSYAQVAGKSSLRYQLFRKKSHALNDGLLRSSNAEYNTFVFDSTRSFFKSAFYLFPSVSPIFWDSAPSKTAATPYFAFSGKHAIRGFWRARRNANHPFALAMQNNNKSSDFAATSTRSAIKTLHRFAALLTLPNFARHPHLSALSFSLFLRGKDASLKSGREQSQQSRISSVISDLSQHLKSAQPAISEDNFVKKAPKFILNELLNHRRSYTAHTANLGNEGADRQYYTFRAEMEFARPTASRATAETEQIQTPHFSKSEPRSIDFQQHVDIDRLTNQVYEAMERKIRVEKERRGL